MLLQHIEAVLNLELCRYVPYAQQIMRSDNSQALAARVLGAFRYTC